MQMVGTFLFGIKEKRWPVAEGLYQFDIMFEKTLLVFSYSIAKHNVFLTVNPKNVISQLKYLNCYKVEYFFIVSHQNITSSQS